MDISRLKKFMPILVIAAAILILGVIALIIFWPASRKEADELEEEEVIFTEGQIPTYLEDSDISIGGYNISDEVSAENLFPGKKVKVYYLAEIDEVFMAKLYLYFGFNKYQKHPSFYRWNNGDDNLSYSDDLQTFSYYSPKGFDYSAKDSKAKDEQDFVYSFLSEGLGIDVSDWEFEQDDEDSLITVKANIFIGGKMLVDSEMTAEFANFSFDKEGNLLSFSLRPIQIEEEKEALSITGTSLQKVLESDDYYKKVVVKTEVADTDASELDKFGEVHTNEPQLSAEDLEIDYFSQAPVLYNGANIIVDSLILETNVAENEKHYILLPLLDKKYVKINTN